MDRSPAPHPQPEVAAPSIAGGELFRTLARALLLAAGLVVLLWFLHTIERVLLLFILALITAVVLNVPVTWLERRGVHRTLAALAVIALLGALIGLLGWLIVPRVADELPRLMELLPALGERAAAGISERLGDHPEIQWQLLQVLEWFRQAVSSVWRFADRMLASLVWGIFLIAVILFMVANPRPLLRGYVLAMPPHLREPATRAFARGSRMVIGWLVATVIVGAIKAVASVIFLLAMGIPGAVLWSVFTFFSQLIPRIGFYLMSLPPVLVALSIDPLTALWVALFYWATSEILGNFVAPRIQRETMNLHEVYLLFVTLALAVAFGVVGVLIASPVAGFLKAYYDEFYQARLPDDPQLESRVDAMMNRRAPAGA